MLLYSIIMLIASIPLFGVAIAIYKGKVNLVMSYHQTKVKDKISYGKALGKALFVVSSAPLVSGVIGLFGEHSAVIVCSLVSLVALLLIGCICIVIVQIKHNKGIF